MSTHMSTNTPAHKFTWMPIPNVYTHICTCLDTHVCAHVYTRLYTHACLHTCLNTCLHTCLRTFPTHIAHTRLHTCLPTLPARMPAHKPAHMPAHIAGTHVYTHVHTRVHKYQHCPPFRGTCLSTRACLCERAWTRPSDACDKARVGIQIEDADAVPLDLGHGQQPACVYACA